MKSFLCNDVQSHVLCLFSLNIFSIYIIVCNEHVLKQWKKIQQEKQFDGLKAHEEKINDASIEESNY